MSSAQLEKHALDLINYSIESTQEFNNRTEGTVKSAKSAKSGRSKQMFNSNFWTQNLSTKFDDQMKGSILKSSNATKKSVMKKKTARSKYFFDNMLNIVAIPKSQDGYIRNSLSQMYDENRKLKEISNSMEVTYQQKLKEKDNTIKELKSKNHDLMIRLGIVEEQLKEQSQLTKNAIDQLVIAKKMNEKSKKQRQEEQQLLELKQSELVIQQEEVLREKYKQKLEERKYEIELQAQQKYKEQIIELENQIQNLKYKNYQLKEKSYDSDYSKLLYQIVQQDRSKSKKKEYQNRDLRLN